MHIERNISDNILRHLFGEKDSTAMRRDMEEVTHYTAVNPRKLLGLRETNAGFVKPRAPYVFTDTEKESFLSLVSHTKVPSGFSSTLIKHIGEKKLSGMKSHDHHVLIQYILPAAVRHILKKGIRNAIIRVGNCFRRICSKAVKVSDIPALRTYVVETVCELEVWFPPGFWDIMPHLLLHLVDELEICGPVHYRWCYSIERYLGTLVRYVRDKSRPEAGMASGYAIDEALGFCTEYFSLFQHTRRRIWDPEEEIRDSGELLVGKGKFRRLSPFERDLMHDYVVTNSVYTVDLVRYCARNRCNPGIHDYVSQCLNSWFNFVGPFLCCKRLVSCSVHLSNRICSTVHLKSSTE